LTISMNNSIKFTKRQHADVLTIGDEYEEFLPSGATVLKRVTTINGEDFAGELIKMIQLYKPAAPGYRHPLEFYVRKTMRGPPKKK